MSGMTQPQQEDLIRAFGNGDHKIIIATTVAEEGLDIEAYDLVIRYQHVTNMVARVQARGKSLTHASTVSLYSVSLSVNGFFQS